MKKTKIKSDDITEKPLSEGEDLNELQREELSGTDSIRTLEVSDTDDDEDEATGDGKLTRSDDDPFSK